MSVRILIAEDERIVALDLFNRMSRLGYTPLPTVAAGEQAIAQAEALKPDLVLMDIGLRGEVDGIAAAAYLREHLDIPVVYLTSYSDPSTLERAKRSEPFGYVLKPYDERDLYTMIEMALHKHHLEQQVRLSQRWLNTTLRSLGDGVIATDSNGLIVFMNPAAEGLTGWTSAEAAGLPFEQVMQIIDESSRQSIESLPQRVLSQGAPIQLQNHCVLRNRSGVETPIDDSAAPIQDEHGATQGVVVIFRDVTARRSAELALFEREQRLLRLFETMVEGVILVNPEGRIVQANPAALRILGVPSAELLTRSHNWQGWKTFHSDGSPMSSEEFPSSLAIRQRVRIPHVRMQLLREDGSLRWISVSAAPMLDDHSNLLGVVVTFEDITDQVNYEEKLKTQEAQLQEASSIGRLAYWIFNPATETATLNDQFFAMLKTTAAVEGGYVLPLQEFGLRFSSPDEVPRVLAQLERAAASDDDARAWEIETRVRCRDGEIRHWLARFRKHVEAKTGQVLVAGAIVDVSEQRQAQDQLDQLNHELEDRVAMRTAQLAQAIEELKSEVEFRRQSEAALQVSQRFVQSILTAAPAIVYIFHLLEQRTIYLNRDFAAVLGFEPGAVPPIQALLHPDDLAAAAENITRFRQASPGEILQHEYRLRDVTGAWRWFQDRVTVFSQDEAGRPTQVLCISDEITGRKQAEWALSQSEAQMRALLHALPDAIFLFDRAGVLHEYQAPDNFALFSTPPNILGRSFRELVPAVGLQQAEQVIQRTWESGTPQIVEYIVETGDGPRTIEARIIPFGDDRLLAVIRDITERRKIESALEAERAFLAQRVAERTAELSQANAELGVALRAKDEFMATMSHELRSPLASILSSSEVLLEDIHGELNEAQRASLKAINESGQHLMDLINDILDLARIEAGKLSLEIAPVWIEDVCSASLRLVREQARRKGLQISTRSDPRLSSLPADERRLKQVLVNLLTNAVKFTPAGGKVSLEVDADPENERINFHVADTGIGIEAGDIPRLFQPFVQLDSGLNRRSEGTGLGLALAQRMVEMMGGSISLSSQPGIGSLFTVSFPLPVAQPADVLARAPAEAAEYGSKSGDSATPGELILLAEDNEIIAQAISAYLQSLAYEVLTARNGQEAVQACEGRQPAVILMDIQMPVMDGLEAIRRIRSSQAAQPKIIALSALAMPGDRERCLQAGADAYLSKPASLQKILNSIRSIREAPSAAR